MFEVIRKSADENVMIVKRPSGFAVSVRETKWHATNAYRGVMEAAWQCIGKCLTKAQAESLFALRTA